MFIVIIILLIGTFYLIHLNNNGKLKIKNVYVKSWEHGTKQARRIFRNFGLSPLSDLIENNYLMAIAVLECEELGDIKYRTDLANTILAETTGMNYYKLQKIDGKKAYPTIYDNKKIKVFVENKIKDIWLDLEQTREQYVLFKKNKNIDKHYDVQISHISKLIADLQKEKNK